MLYCMFALADNVKGVVVSGFRSTQRYTVWKLTPRKRAASLTVSGSSACERRTSSRLMGGQAAARNECDRPWQWFQSACFDLSLPVVCIGPVIQGARIPSRRSGPDGHGRLGWAGPLSALRLRGNRDRRLGLQQQLFFKRQEFRFGTLRALNNSRQSRCKPHEIRRTVYQRPAVRAVWPP